LLTEGSYCSWMSKKWERALSKRRFMLWMRLC